MFNQNNGIEVKIMVSLSAWCSETWKGRFTGSAHGTGTSPPFKDGKERFSELNQVGSHAQLWVFKVEALVLPRLAPVPYLLGLGLEGSVRCLKVWRLDTKDKTGGPGPELIRVSR